MSLPTDNAQDCTNYNCFDDDLGIYHENECGEELSGGVNAAVLLACGHHLTDPSSAAQILAELNASPRRAWLITGASFSIEAPQPVDASTVVPCKTVGVSTYNRSGSYKNPNVSNDMVEFHQPMFGGRTFGGMILNECATDEARNPQVTFINRPITFKGGRILPGVTTETQRFEGSFYYIGLYDDNTYPKPAGIF